MRYQQTDRPTDQQTKRPTNKVAYRVACTRLKKSERGVFDFLLGVIWTWVSKEWRMRRAHLLASSKHDVIIFIWHQLIQAPAVIRSYFLLNLKKDHQWHQYV